MASRDLTAAMTAAITAGKVRPVVFVEGAFYASGSPDESFLRMWSGLGEFSWDSKTWAGAGKLLRISPLEESNEVRAVGFTVELSGIPTTELSTALQNVRQGRSGKVWLGLMGRQGYLSLPGEGSDYASTPDSAALKTLTGDIEIEVDFTVDDWAFSSLQTLVSRNTWPTAIAFNLRVITGRFLQAWWAPDGTSATQVTLVSSAAISAANGDRLQCKFTLDVDSGTSPSEYAAKFWTSTDFGVTWTQLGVTRTGPATSLHAGSTPLEVGINNVTGWPLKGKIYSAKVRQGIDGPVIASFDPSLSASNGATSFVSSLTGETWTVSSSGSPAAQIVVLENQLVDDPYLVRAGRMDYVSVQAGGDTTTIVAQYEDRLVDLERSRERRYTDEDQKYVYATDVGFEFVTSLQDKQLIWGGPGAAASPMAAPSYADNIDAVETVGYRGAGDRSD